MATRPSRRLFVAPLLAVAALLAVASATRPSDAQGAPARILPLGDSITESDEDHKSYRWWLWKDLLSLSLPVDFVGHETNHHLGPPPVTDFDMHHEGHWGKRADWILEQLQTQGWAASLAPDVVLLLIGTNDLLVGQSEAGTAAEVGQIVDELRLGSPSVAVLVGTLYGMPGIAGSVSATEIATYNQALLATVLAKDAPGAPVLLVDQGTGFDGAADTFDGVHPDESGEEKLADRWQLALVPLLEGAQGTFTDLGGGAPGTAGTPHLSGSGLLTPFSVFGLSLEDAAPSALALLFVSGSSSPASFLGGTLHAFPPQHQIVLATDAGGGLQGKVLWPPGVPSGAELWFQAAVADGSVAGHGASLSNALRIAAP